MVEPTNLTYKEKYKQRNRIEKPPSGSDPFVGGKNAKSKAPRLPSPSKSPVHQKYAPESNKNKITTFIIFIQEFEQVISNFTTLVLAVLYFQICSQAKTFHRLLKNFSKTFIYSPQTF